MTTYQPSLLNASRSPSSGRVIHVPVSTLPARRDRVDAELDCVEASRSAVSELPGVWVVVTVVS
jgi:hypothetical protein